MMSDGGRERSSRKGQGKSKTRQPPREGGKQGAPRRAAAGPSPVGAEAGVRRAGVAPRRRVRVGGAGRAGARRGGRQVAAGLHHRAVVRRRTSSADGAEAERAVLPCRGERGAGRWRCVSERAMRVRGPAQMRAKTSNMPAKRARLEAEAEAESQGEGQGQWAREAAQRRRTSRCKSCCPLCCASRSRRSPACTPPPCRWRCCTRTPA